VATVQCKTHGLQPQAMVCQHIVTGRLARERVGFFWTNQDPGNPRPDAWCADCQRRVNKTSGEWIGEALQHLEPRILCGECYDLVKRFHLGEDPWS
jgi:hypothetical protein